MDNEMSHQERRDFRNVIAVAVIGCIAVLLVPLAFHLIL